MFSRATRKDGRQYWSLFHITVYLDKTLCVTVDPTSYMSTKAMLRPDLSPDEQGQ